MSFYHKKFTIISDGRDGYKEKIVMCLHNGLMRNKMDGDISLTITEYITLHSSAMPKPFDTIYELLNYVNGKGYKFNKEELENSYRELKNLQTKVITLWSPENDKLSF